MSRKASTLAANTFLRRASILVAGTGVYGTTVYFTYHYLKMSKEQAKIPSDLSYVNSPQRTEQFQKVAGCYDDCIGRDELFMGINLLRRALIYFHASGTVLEVGAGTSRNLPFYRKAVDRVILTDASDQMLEETRKKIQALRPNDRRRFAVMAADAAKLDLPDDAFDTVVDTFGLCSYDDPVVVLRELSRVCKPNGKILLLEHGRSKTWDFVTNHLDKYAEQHAANWGCVWNRDLDHIIDTAGVGVEILHRWHFGTTYYMVCRPIERGDK